MGELAAMLVTDFNKNLKTRGIVAAAFEAQAHEPLYLLDARSGAEAAIFRNGELHTARLELGRVGLLHGNGVRVFEEAKDGSDVKRRLIHEGLEEMMRGHDAVATINRPVADGEHPGIYKAKEAIATKVLTATTGEDTTRFYVMNGGVVAVSQGERSERRWLDITAKPGEDLALRVMMAMAAVMNVPEPALALGVDVAQTEKGLAVVKVTHEPTRVPSSGGKIVLQAEAAAMADLLEARQMSHEDE